jgi:hypothetical protein
VGSNPTRRTICERITETDVPLVPPDSGNTLAAMSHTDFDGSDIVRACIRKKGYPREKFARSAVAGILRANPDAEVRVYACRHCGLWHVGGSPGTGTRDASLRHRQDRRRPVTIEGYRGRERRHDALSDRGYAAAVAPPTHHRQAAGGSGPTLRDWLDIDERPQRSHRDRYDDADG